MHSSPRHNLCYSGPVSPAPAPLQSIRSHWTKFPVLIWGSSRVNVCGQFLFQSAFKHSSALNSCSFAKWGRPCSFKSHAGVWICHLVTKFFPKIYLKSKTGFDNFRLVQLDRFSKFFSTLCISITWLDSNCSKADDSYI